MSKNKMFLLLIGCLCFIKIASAQNAKDSLAMEIQLMWNDKPLELNKNYVSKMKDTLQISKFKCFISKIEIYYFDKTTFLQSNSYHLIDVENPNSQRIPICKKTDKAISKIIFSIGIDSLASVSGAIGGNLDPSNGMYWAWQSGYINMKIEGKSNSCKTRNNAFQFHIGGYLQPYYAMRKVEFNINDNKNITIGIDMANFFSEIPLSSTNAVMIPGETAIKMANHSVNMFEKE